MKEKEEYQKKGERRLRRNYEKEEEAEDEWNEKNAYETE